MKGDADLQAWAETRTATAPRDSDVERLLARARARRRRPRPAFIGASVGVALAAATLVWVSLPRPKGATGWTWRPTRPPSDVAAAPAPKLLSVGTHPLHDDTVEVAEGARVWPLQTGPTTRLHLAAGTVTATVSHRTEGDHFAVELDGYTVEVVGTRFTVQHTPFEVRVTEGTVRVSAETGDQQWTVSAGEWLAEGRVQRPRLRDRPPTQPSIQDLQQLVLDGQHDSARTHLRARLDRRPRDGAAWRLLAQLEEQAGHPDAAAHAWLALVEHGSRSERAAGRFEAARLLEASPDRVVPLLEACLEQPHPLAGEARLRLATAHSALGQEDRARAVLEEAARLHAGTAVGTEAARRLAR